MNTDDVKDQGPSNPDVIYVSSAPSGACVASSPIYIVKSTGTIYTCDNGTWAAQTGGGGYTLPIATTTVLGGIKPDGTSITVDPGTGVASATGGGSAVPLPFFGTVPSTGWTRPALAAFTKWLNLGGEAVGIGDSGDNYSSLNPISPGTGYVPGDTVTIAGGTLNPSGDFPEPAALVLTVTDTQIVTATLVSPGAGGTPGSAQVIGTTGVGTMFILDVTIGGDGTISSIDDISNPGDYTTNPTVLSAEPVADNSSSGITGAVVNITMGACKAALTNFGSYATPPSNPVSQSATSGSGTGATWGLLFYNLATATDNTGGLPLIINAAFPGGGLYQVEQQFSLVTALLKPAPSTPWSIAVAHANVQANIGSNAYNWSPEIVLYNSGSDSALVLSANSNADTWQVQQITNASAPNFVSTTVTGTLGNLPGPYFNWWKVDTDGTNVNFYISGEGAVYLPIYTDTLTDFIGTIDYVGFGMSRLPKVVTSPGSALSILWNWQEGTP